MNRQQRRAAQRQHKGDPIAPIAASVGTGRIPGGCPDCDAYQTLDASAAPVYRLTVHHDDTCPTYLRLKETRP